VTANPRPGRWRSEKFALTHVLKAELDSLGIAAHRARGIELLEAIKNGEAVATTRLQRPEWFTR
jgi:hypothetical protein